MFEKASQQDAPYFLTTLMTCALRVPQNEHGKSSSEGRKPRLSHPLSSTVTARGQQVGVG